MLRHTTVPLYRRTIHSQEFFKLSYSSAVLLWQMWMNFEFTVDGLLVGCWLAVGWLSGSACMGWWLLQPGCAGGDPVLCWV